MPGIAPEAEGKYDILQNNKGEILVAIKSREGGPEDARLVFDGGKHAVLYRSREYAIVLNNINPEAVAPIKNAERIFVVEFDEGYVVREYEAPLRMVKKLPIGEEYLPKD